MARHLGINATKNGIAFALLEPTEADEYRIAFSQRLAFDISEPCNLVDNVAAVFDSLRASHGAFKVHLCPCSAGAHGSSLEAIKAEALIEYACSIRDIKPTNQHPRSFKRTLDCGKEEKWQAKAKVLFNGKGTIGYFSTGVDGAAAAAFCGWKQASSNEI